MTTAETRRIERNEREARILRLTATRAEYDRTARGHASPATRANAREQAARFTGYIAAERAAIRALSY